MNCPNCGAPLEDGAIFCASCGAAVKSREQNAYVPDPGSTPVPRAQTVELPSQYRPIGAWGYFGYSLLFSIPLVGFICQHQPQELRPFLLVRPARFADRDRHPRRSGRCHGRGGGVFPGLFRSL